MDTLTAFMEYDGGFDAAFTHRTQADTIAGTVWRFIMDGNKTIVAVPYQSPHAPAKAAHCVPKRIDSILAAGDFGCAVSWAAWANPENCQCTWDAEIQEKTEEALQKWQAKLKLPATAEREKEQEKAHRQRSVKWAEANVEYHHDTPTREQIEQWKGQGLTQRVEEHRRANLKKRQEITAEVFAELNAIDASNAYKNEQKRISDHRAKIEGNYRKKIEAQKTKLTATIEADALAMLGQALSAFTVEKLDTAKLKVLLNFIQEDICRGNRINPVVRDADLRCVLAKVEELTGANITERVFMTYAPGMTAHVEEWAKETAEAEKIEEAAARRHVLERVRFVAAFPDGTLYLLQSVSRCVHDERDAELFRLVAPNEAARAEIERTAQIEAEKRATIRLQQRTGQTDGRTPGTRPAGLHEIRKADGQVIFRALTVGFAEVECMGKRITLPPKARLVVAQFVEAYEKRRTTCLTGNEVLTAIDRGGESMTDAFKGHKEAWSALIRRVEGTRDLYDFMPAVIANVGEISGQSPP